MAKYSIDEVKSYRFDTEEEAENFIIEEKENALNEGYTLNSYTTTHKEKKSKGEVIDEAFLVKIKRIYNNFWDVEE